MSTVAHLDDQFPRALDASDFGDLRSEFTIWHYFQIAVLIRHEKANDSIGTTQLAWLVLKLDDATCEANDEGTLVALEIWTNGGGAFEPLALPTGRPITLGFGYFEARFAQGRECSQYADLPTEGRRDL